MANGLQPVNGGTMSGSHIKKASLRLLDRRDFEEELSSLRAMGAKEAIVWLRGNGKKVYRNWRQLVELLQT